MNFDNKYPECSYTLKKVVTVDFGEEGKETYTIFDKTKEQIKVLFECYNKLYNCGVFDGSFEQYLLHESVKFETFEADVELSI